VYGLRVSQDGLYSGFLPANAPLTDMHIDIVMAIPTSTLITKTVLLSKSLVLKPIMTIVTAADDGSAVT
jgi:hypothetical protein